MDKTLLKSGERLDDLGGGYRIIQNPKYFLFGTDAVLLADFAKMKKGERAVDLGTGSGILPLLMCARTDGLRAVGIEIQQPLADMARRSAALNGLEDSIEIVTGDLKDAATLVRGHVDAVVSNPPYEKKGSGRENPSESVNTARREIACTLDDVVHAASRLLRTGGRFYVIYRTQRFAELMQRMRSHSIEPKRVQLVSQRRGHAPNFALVEGRRCAGEGMKFLPPLALYEDDGTYTPQAKKIYRMEEC